MQATAEPMFGTFFPETDRAGRPSLDELRTMDECFSYVTQRFGRMKYILGTSLDFILLAQQISAHSNELKVFEHNLNHEEIFQRYPPIETRGERQANTLTLRVGEHAFGIRSLEELVLRYFVRQNKPSYPSAYVYNTGQWRKYLDLLAKIFSLSSFGRFELFKRLVDFGNQQLPTVDLRVTPMPVRGPFELVLANYPRSNQGENGGLAFQAIAFGYVSVVYSHLNIIAAKVRSGSARQKRVGDIDCYYGDSLVVTFEVKDYLLDEDNAENEIGEFKATIEQTNVLGIIICSNHSETLERSLNCSALRLLSLNTMILNVNQWDLIKQNEAVTGVLHFLANIEQNKAATDRLRNFLSLNVEDMNSLES